MTTFSQEPSGTKSGLRQRPQPDYAAAFRSASEELGYACLTLAWADLRPFFLKEFRAARLKLPEIEAAYPRLADLSDRIERALEVNYPAPGSFDGLMQILAEALRIHDIGPDKDLRGGQRLVAKFIALMSEIADRGEIFASTQVGKMVLVEACEALASVESAQTQTIERAARNELILEALSKQISELRQLSGYGLSFIGGHSRRSSLAEGLSLDHAPLLLLSAMRRLLTQAGIEPGLPHEVAEARAEALVLYADEIEILMQEGRGAAARSLVSEYAFDQKFVPRAKQLYLEPYFQAVDLLTTLRDSSAGTFRGHEQLSMELLRESRSADQLAAWICGIVFQLARELGRADRTQPQETRVNALLDVFLAARSKLRESQLKNSLLERERMPVLDALEAARNAGQAQLLHELEIQITEIRAVLNLD
ncbi:MAG: hypothetical protein K1X83_09300 [Oligoflexia bacterium]|nr:hypothetical protein [Oligoflexia bacterium]